MNHQELRNDKDVVMAAVFDKADAIKFAATEKKSDRDIALTALQVVAKDKAPFNFALFWRVTPPPPGTHLLLRSRSLPRQSQEGVGKVLGLVNPVLKEDRGVVMEAVKVAGKLYSYLSCVKCILPACSDETIKPALLRAGWSHCDGRGKLCQHSASSLREEYEGARWRDLEF